MAKTELQGTVKGARRRGRQKKRWEDNINEWTGMESKKISNDQDPIQLDLTSCLQKSGDSMRAAEDREG